uniref:Uncharacterized protein n=1 Tax=Rhizophora mucronata TaxID=61149 RepID=A0A2P2PP07_RHIMU
MADLGVFLDLWGSIKNFQSRRLIFNPKVTDLVVHKNGLALIYYEHKTLSMWFISCA